MPFSYIASYKEPLTRLQKVADATWQLCQVGDKNRTGSSSNRVICYNTTLRWPIKSYCALVCARCPKGEPNQQVRCCRPFEVFVSVAHTPTYCASTWRLHGDTYGLINTFYGDDDAGIASSSARRDVAKELSVLDSDIPEGRGSVRVKDGYSSEQTPRCFGDISKPINYH